jgi:hypothetical protein
MRHQCILVPVEMPGIKSNLLLTIAQDLFIKKEGLITSLISPTKF